jgi:hypothetical protein
MEVLDHESIGAATYNRCWELLETGQRTIELDRELLTCAFASRYHWTQVGGADRVIMSDWMVSRAAAAIGEGTIAVDYARCAVDSALAPGTADWLVASTAEGMARAYDAVGDEAERERWYRRAEELTANIADAEDRELIEVQLAEVPHRGTSARQRS